MRAILKFFKKDFDIAVNNFHRGNCYKYSNLCNIKSQPARSMIAGVGWRFELQSLAESYSSMHLLYTGQNQRISAKVRQGQCIVLNLK